MQGKGTRPWAAEGVPLGDALALTTSESSGAPEGNDDVDVTADAGELADSH